MVDFDAIMAEDKKREQVRQQLWDEQVAASEAFEGVVRRLGREARALIQNDIRLDDLTVRTWQASRSALSEEYVEAFKRLRTANRAIEMFVEEHRVR